MSTKVVNNLSSALFPKARGKTLALLFGTADRSFYLREVADKTGLAVGQVQRELARLSDSGIVRRFRQGRHVYFQANECCPIFMELRGLVAKTVGAHSAVKQALAPLADQISIAFLFGSFVRKQESHDSDLDLCVVGDATFASVVTAVRGIEPVIQREIHPTVYPENDFVAKFREGHHFVRSVVKEEKIYLLGSDDELRDLLEQPLDSNARVVGRRNSQTSRRRRS
jgi:predicted nucleotidyltransferase